MSAPLYAVVGPTGTGKTDLAIAIAEAIGGEIVSVDSAQVFRGLNVGTAKPTAEEQAKVRHHVIDVIEPDQQWSGADYARAAGAAIEDIRGRGRTPIVCGGTGLWLRALTHGFFDAPPIDPEVREGVRRALAESGAPAMHRVLSDVDPVAAGRISPNDPQRIGRALEVYRQVGVPISQLQARHGFRQVRHSLVGAAIAWPRDTLAERLRQRAEWMYAHGILEETQACLDRGIDRTAPGLSIIGYRDACRVLLEGLAVEEAVTATVVTTRQYAKRQRNWFRHVPEVAWIEPDSDPERVWSELRGRAGGLD